MPTYEYYCENCDSKFEEFQKITDPPLIVCSKCGVNGSVKRLISPGAGLLFKGSGFYITDYRSSDYKKAAESEKSSSKSDSSGSSDSSKKKETTSTTKS
ncbi:MAG: zinc ribbon domain-containing protein [candidate division Zixibacteria bacterium]|nr:zinc ribbon domain-containing protein [candidate division Zixibacteria bacterium]